MIIDSDWDSAVIFSDPLEGVHEILIGKATVDTLLKKVSTRTTAKVKCSNSPKNIPRWENECPG